MTADACQLCMDEREALDRSPLRERVHVTEGWRVVVHRSGLPGWLLLVPLRHVQSLAELTEAEALELGTLMREATRALQQVVDAERTYVLMFAEGIKHVHFSIAPRLREHPAERRGAGVVAYNRDDEPIDEDQRDELANRLAAEWPVTKRVSCGQAET